VTLSTSRYVLDSYALLAWLQEEAGHKHVDDLLVSASQGKAALHMSVINLAEVQYMLLRGDPDPDQPLAVVETLPISFASADEYIPEVVQLKASHPISLADCFAAALAQDLDCPLITGDAEFRKLESLVKIEWLE
jgi:ribonuclease VapC